MDTYLNEKPLHIHWFRQDLRLSDNPALAKCAVNGDVLPIFILDDCNAGSQEPGAVSRVWLHHSLLALNKSLNGALRVFKGNPIEIIPKLISETGANGVYWNRCYEPWQIERDRIIKLTLRDKKVECESFNGSLLWEPWDILKKDGTPYKVFTPFYRRGCLSAKEPRIPISPPADITLSNKEIGMNDINDLELLPNLRWDQEVFEGWDIGEKAANLKVIDFIENRLYDYKDGRNFPSKKNVSRLSPHLHFGEVSPNQVWHTASHPKYMNSTGLDHFLSELGWREFSHSLLYFFPNLPTESLQTRFETFPWIEDLDLLVRWKEGNTGFPIVDAGMRELWRTGYMHNRVRMIVGSFLVKNLRLHWNNGLDWFWDCLVDADLANNSAGWQWIAGCGADAAPYFRIFNPVLQGEKFDKDGIYTKQFVPELKDLPNKYLHCPWTAPESVLKAANVCLGKSYPHPIVDLKQSREAALKAFSDMKASN